MHIETARLTDLKPDRAAQRRRLVQQAWPDSSHTDHDLAMNPMSLLLVEEDLVLATLDILAKQLVHRGHTYRVSGLSSVVTDARSRHRGYGRALAKSARLSMQNQRRDLACSPATAT